MAKKQNREELPTVTKYANKENDEKVTDRFLQMASERKLDLEIQDIANVMDIVNFKDKNAAFQWYGRSQVYFDEKVEDLDEKFIFISLLKVYLKERFDKKTFDTKGYVDAVAKPIESFVNSLISVLANIISLKTGDDLNTAKRNLAKAGTLGKFRESLVGVVSDQVDPFFTVEE